MTINHQGNSPVEIERILMMGVGSKPSINRFTPRSLRAKDTLNQSGVIRPHPNPGELAFFSNGWQSWSYTGTYASNDRYNKTRLGFITSPMWFNHGTPRSQKQGQFASDMFGILGDRKHRTGILAGFLSQKEHFGSLEVSTNSLYPSMALWANGDQARLDPGTKMSTDWAAIQFVDIDSPDPFESYLNAASREHYLSNSHQKPFIGWCSWYQFFQDISESKITANLNSAFEMKNILPINLFQIDDGFEAQVGDWFNFSDGFPNGVASLANKIKQVGFTPGIWLAPFIVHSNSKLKRQHSDWILRNRLGQPVNAGFVWNNFNTALDLTHSEALDYVKELIHTASHKWGYQFLKLDFLYAAALRGCYRDRSKTRAQVLRMGLEALREAAGPEVHLLGCGVPLGPSIGIFDSVRISPDVDQNWQPSFLGIEYPFKNEYPMPSTRNAIHNTLTRSQLHNRWWINDPDCMLVRPNSHLTIDEVRSLATVIACTGGPLLLSDDLPHVPAERLQIAKQLVPLIGRRPQILDWFDTSFPHLLRLDLESTIGKWYLLAIFNWKDTPQDYRMSLNKFGITEGQYLAREFWGGTCFHILEGNLQLNQIPAHGVRLFALRRIQPQQASYIGGDLHISQGLEITKWSATSSNLNFQIERPGDTQGQIDLYLPQTPTMMKINHHKIDWQRLDEQIYRVAIQFENLAEVSIS
jgi:alpha-galactosidase